jgi:outer membrane protein TolC
MLARTTAALALALAFLTWGTRAAAQTPISYIDALARARQLAPDLAVAHARESIARAEIAVAGTYPNPTVSAGTSTQAAKVSVGASIPLVVLGQRGAAIDASRADLATVQMDTEVTWTEVRAATARAFVALWLAERTATARGDAAAIVKHVEGAVLGRVEVGAAPQVEGLRVRAERLRADADADEARQLVEAAAIDLGRWIGITDGTALRAMGDPTVPNEPPPYGVLAARMIANPAVRREELDARAAEARADRERALVRPMLTLDLGIDALDPTLPTTNYRAQLGVEVPLFNQRGGYIERERMNAAAARTRSGAERIRRSAELIASYRTFAAISARTKALAEGVVPAADAAAVAMEESYTLGHAPLVAVLDAEKARIDARLTLLEARAARANAWIDVERAIGEP